MLEKIKSIFFIKNLFSKVEDKRKLNLAKYNKSLQNIMSINLLNYEIFSQKYIIYKTKTKGKEYDRINELMIYKGEFLNGERNGKGKEYNYKYIIFEGEYLNGKRSGKGKEYSYNKLIFVGEYLKGEKNGKGKEYEHKTGELIFEGEYFKGERWNGKGKEYKYGEIIFEGEYINGKKIFSNGEEYIEKKKDNNDESIKIDIINKFKDGKVYAKEYCDGELIYEGEYLNGKRNGKGKEYKGGELILDGEYFNGEIIKGKLYDSLRSGELLFDGEYFNGLYWNGRGRKYIEIFSVRSIFFMINLFMKENFYMGKR